MSDDATAEQLRSISNDVRTPLENLKKRLNKRIQLIGRNEVTKNTIKDIYCIQRELCKFLMQLQRELNELRVSR